MRAPWLVALLTTTGCHALFNLEQVDPPAGDASVAADAPPIAGFWRFVAAGDGSTCGITVDDQLYCWGRNESGQLGNGDTDGLDQVRPSALPGRWKRVALGNAHACGIQSDDTLWCWGDGSDGQLGVQMISSTGPVQVGTGTWSSVSAAENHTCAIDTSGALWCWGYNDDGQLGDGTTLDRDMPVRVIGSQTWLQVAAGAYHVCALDSANVLYCWGDSDQGALGNTSAADDQTTPLAVTTSETWTSVTTGYDVTCGVTSNGDAYCWGDGRTGVLGVSPASIREVPVRIASPATGWLELVAGTTQTCGRHSDGSVWCWGDATVGPLDADSITPVRVDGVSADQLALGRTHTCRLTANTIFCTGNGDVGQLGDGVQRATRTPQEVPHPQLSLTWKDVVAGEDFTCAIDNADDLFCWGDNLYGAVGDGGQLRRLVPFGHTSRTWRSLAAGRTHACAITQSQGTLCWGTSFGGGIGDGSNTTTFRTPVTVVGNHTFSSLAVGDHACAIEPVNDGTVYCWGDNANGELGTGTTTDSASPITNNLATGQVRIAAGHDHTCSLDMSNTIRCWGSNDNGQVGNNGPVGDSEYSSSPQAVNAPQTGDGTYVDLFAGADRSCAVTSTGAAYCWGTNHYRSAFNSSTQELPTPTLTDNTRDWKSLAPSTNFTCGIASPGELYCWGYNHRSQLGDGTQTDIATITRVGTSVWSKVATGSDHACAIQPSGGLYCWGSNRDGQLGTGAGWIDTWVGVIEP